MGAAFSIISEDTYKNLWSHTASPALKHTTGLLLKTYTGESISLKGQIEVQVAYNGQSKMLNLLVVKGHGPSLIERDWLRAITLDWPQLLHLQHATTEYHRQIIDRHPNVFKDDIEGTSAKLQVSTARHHTCILKSTTGAIRPSFKSQRRY